MEKVLIITNTTRKFTTFMKNTVDVLQSLNYDVHICSNFSKYNNYEEEQKKYNVKMHHIDFERNPLNLKNIKAYRQLMKLMQEEKFDLVHCNTPIGGVLGRICAKKFKVPKVIYTAHGFHFYKGAPLINNIVYKNIEKILAKYTDVLITINKEDYEAAKKFKLRNNGQVYKVHGVGINTANFEMKNFDRNEYREKLNLSQDDIVLIAVGELNKNKNYKTIIKAINQLENRKIHLLICGEGKEKKKMIKLVEKYKLNNNVHFLGFRNDVMKLLLTSDIFIQASYREGLSRAIMEAMSAGLPCIASRIRGNIDLLEDNKGGTLNDVNSIKEFSNSILKLAKDKNLRTTMGEFNKRAIRKYDTENVKKELLEIYKSI